MTAVWDEKKHPREPVGSERGGEFAPRGETGLVTRVQDAKTEGGRAYLNSERAFETGESINAAWDPTGGYQGGGDWVMKPKEQWRRIDPSEPHMYADLWPDSYVSWGEKFGKDPVLLDTSPANPRGSADFVKKWIVGRGGQDSFPWFTELRAEYAAQMGLPDPGITRTWAPHEGRPPTGPELREATQQFIETLPKAPPEQPALWRGLGDVTDPWAKAVANAKPGDTLEVLPGSFSRSPVKAGSYAYDGNAEAVMLYVQPGSRGLADKRPWLRDEEVISAGTYEVVASELVKPGGKYRTRYASTPKRHGTRVVTVRQVDVRPDSGALAGAGWDESKHPREPQGTEKGGQFARAMPGDPWAEWEALRKPYRERGIPVYRGLKVAMPPFSDPNDERTKFRVKEMQEGMDWDLGIHWTTDPAVAETFSRPNAETGSYGVVVEALALPEDVIPPEEYGDYAAYTVFGGREGGEAELPVVPGSTLMVQHVTVKLPDGERYDRYADEPAQMLIKVDDQSITSSPSFKGKKRKKPGVQAAAWDASKHPRHPAGSEAGGEFAPLDTYQELAQMEGPKLVPRENRELTAVLRRPGFATGVLGEPEDEFVFVQLTPPSDPTGDPFYKFSWGKDAAGKTVTKLWTADDKGAPHHQDIVDWLNASGYKYEELGFGAGFGLEPPTEFYAHDNRPETASRVDRDVQAALRRNRRKVMQMALSATAWLESEHPRHPGGSEQGGEFAPKAGREPSWAREGIWDPTGPVKFWPARSPGTYSPIGSINGEPFWKAFMDPRTGAERAFWFVNPYGFPHHQDMAKALPDMKDSLRLSGHGDKPDGRWLESYIRKDLGVETITPLLRGIWEVKAQLMLQDHRKDLEAARDAVAEQEPLAASVAEERERLEVLAAAAWVEAQHPRRPSGTAEGGEFAAKFEEGGEPPPAGFPPGIYTPNDSVIFWPQEIYDTLLANLRRVPRDHRRDIQDAREMLSAVAASAFNPDSEEFTKTVERLARQYEKVYRRAAKRAAAEFVAAAKVMRAAGGPQPDEIVKAAALLDSFQRLTGVARRDLLKQVLAALTLSYTDAPEPSGRNLALEDFLQLLQQQAGVQAARLMAGAQDAAANVMLDSMAEGWSVPQTAAKLQEKLESISKWQATMLARTDLIALGNGASLQRAVLLNDPQTQFKTWLATPDERTRINHRHAHGQTVPIQQPFTVGGEQLLYPGDPSASDGNVINCRCTVIYSDSAFGPPGIKQIAMLPDLAVSAAAWDESEHPRHPEGSPQGGEFAAREGGALPPAPGTAPIPAGHARLFHYTDAPADVIRREGLRIDKAKGNQYLEPNRVWGSGEFPDAAFEGGRNVVEFHMAADDPRWDIGAYSPGVKYDPALPGDDPRQVQAWADHLTSFKSNVTFTGDITPADFVAVHEPWQSHARYILENYPGLTRKQLDDLRLRQLGPDYAKADEYLRPLTAAAWDEAKHPRQPSGSEKGGEFRSSDEGAPFFGIGTGAQLEYAISTWDGSEVRKRQIIKRAEQLSYLDKLPPDWGIAVPPRPAPRPMPVLTPLEDYTQSSFYINAALRGVERMRAQDIPVVKALDDLIDNEGADAPPGMIVYRGDSGVDTEAHWVDPGFLSTTSDPNIALDFSDNVMELHVTPGTRYYRVPFGTYDMDQKEIIFPRGTEVQKQPDGTWVIKASGKKPPVPGAGQYAPRSMQAAAAWEESKHPRHPKGTEAGGRFAPAGGLHEWWFDFENSSAVRAHQQGQLANWMSTGGESLSPEHAQEVAAAADHFQQLATSSETKHRELYRGTVMDFDKFVETHQRGQILEASALESWTPDPGIADIYTDTQFVGGEDTGRWARIRYQLAGQKQGFDFPDAPETLLPRGTQLEVVSAEQQGGDGSVWLVKVRPHGVVTAAASPEAVLENQRTRARERLTFGLRWDPAKHPRHPAGSPQGGEFAPAENADGAVVDWSEAEKGFREWASQMEQYYTESQGYPPDYWEKERARAWSTYQDAVNTQLPALQARLNGAQVPGLKIQPQLNPAINGDMDVVLNPETRPDYGPDFTVELPAAEGGLSPSFTVWTYPAEANKRHSNDPNWYPQPEATQVEDVLDITDTDFFPDGPDSDLAGNYARALDAARGMPDEPGFVTIYRGMSDAEYDAWSRGDEIPIGKFFAGIPTAQYAQDISGAPPQLYAFRVPRNMLMQTGEYEYQLKKRGRMKQGGGGVIEPSLQAAAVAYTGGGGMICLYPQPDEAKAIARENGQPPEDLHVTLLYYEEGVPGEADYIIKSLGFDGLKGEITGVGRFKAGEDGVPVVGIVSAVGLNELRATLAERIPGYSERFGFVPHVTLGYEKPGGESVKDPEGAAGLPVTFKAVSVKNGGAKRQDVVTAAGWDESNHPRHPAGSEQGGEFAPAAARLATGYQGSYPRALEDAKLGRSGLSGMFAGNSESEGMTAEEYRAAGGPGFASRFDAWLLKRGHPPAAIEEFNGIMSQWSHGDRAQELARARISEAYNNPDSPVGQVFQDVEALNTSLWEAWYDSGRHARLRQDYEREKANSVNPWSQYQQDLASDKEFGYPARTFDKWYEDEIRWRHNSGTAGSGKLYRAGSVGAGVESWTTLAEGASPTAVTDPENRWTPNNEETWPELKAHGYRIIGGIANLTGSPGESEITLVNPERLRALRAAAWDESKHPRQPSGNERGGEFAPAGGRFLPGDRVSGRTLIGDHAVEGKVIGQTRFGILVETKSGERLTVKEASAQHTGASGLADEDRVESASMLGEKWARGKSAMGSTEYRNGPYSIIGRKVSGQTHTFTTAYAVTHDKTRVGIASSLDNAKLMAARDAVGAVPSPEEILATINTGRYHADELFGGSPAALSPERFERAVAALNAAYEAIDPAADRVRGLRNQLAETMRRGRLERYAAMTSAAWDESKHPREPSGTEKGGQFTSKEAFLAETLDQRVARLKALADLAPGERVIVPISGRTGTVVKKVSKHSGYKIHWDEPVFGVTEGNVLASNLARLPESAPATASSLRRTQSGDRLMERLAESEGPEGIKALWEDDPQDAVATVLDLNNAPATATIERAKDAVRDESRKALLAKHPEGEVTVYRGGEGNENLEAWSLDRGTAKFFAKGDESRIREQRVPISEVEAYLPAVARGRWRGFGEEEVLLRPGLSAAGWSEDEHPRWPAGDERGGEFRPKEGALISTEATIGPRAFGGYRIPATNALRQWLRDYGGYQSIVDSWPDLSAEQVDRLKEFIEADYENGALKGAPANVRREARWVMKEFGQPDFGARGKRPAPTPPPVEALPVTGGARSLLDTVKIGGGRNEGNMLEAVRTVDATLQYPKVPGEPTITIKGAPGSRHNARFWRRSNSLAPDSITLSANANNPISSVTHELGHYLDSLLGQDSWSAGQDLQAIERRRANYRDMKARNVISDLVFNDEMAKLDAQERQYGRGRSIWNDFSSSQSAGTLAPVIAALKDTEMYRKLRHASERGTLSGSFVYGGRSFAPGRSHIRYMLEPQELIARSFEQYVAAKNPGSKLARTSRHAFSQLQPGATDDRPPEFPGYMKGDDLEYVNHAWDEVLRNRGLLKGRGYRSGAGTRT